jgi:2-polyprenyl-3-methyl-5-hydroxy-6-metoxy-1,4-benzoquinol methylase
MGHHRENSAAQRLMGFGSAMVSGKRRETSSAESIRGAVLKSTDYYNSERREMLPFVPARRKRVLEIGCGEGRFSAALTGVEESWGIEPSAAAEVAKTHLTRVLRATFDEAENTLPLQYFDLIICNDVIEHMPDHAKFMSCITKYIVPGGLIMGSIPNVRFYVNMFEYMFRRDWRYRDYGILDRTHLAFFTRKSLDRLLKQCGFEVLEIRGINKNYRFSNSAKAWVSLIGAYGFVALTFGYFADIRYLQFGFQATPLGAH